MKSRIWIMTAVAFALALGACAKKHPTQPAASADQPPVANSPANAVRRFAWGWARRDTAVYASVFTDDFAFAFDAGDSAGNRWPNRAWSRQDELRSTAHAFVGGGSVPRAADVSLLMNDQIADLPDPRPGHDPGWHRTIRTIFDLKVTVIDAQGTPSVTPVVGYARFFLTRGDSAVLSPDRVAAGARDSTLWYIDRWEDETVGIWGGLHANPSRTRTWGSLKDLYW
jgi:hypothetical protein